MFNLINASLPLLPCDPQSGDADPATLLSARCFRYQSRATRRLGLVFCGRISRLFRTLLATLSGNRAT